MLGDQERGKAALAISGHVDTDRPLLGQHRLGPLAVALITHPLGLGCAGRVAQVMVQLTGQGPLDQGLLESQGRRIDSFGRHRAVTKRLQQLGRNHRQRCRLGSWFARHRHSLTSCYAPNTKLLTGPTP
ncbi:hypothetical protein Z046_12605 [Pseudomonas aeruginosa VRFPA09]|nr:hypothetical protein Z046_12605 [Pseudomonas aeruginosa VRFPA09]